MNKKQKTFLWIGIALFVLMSIFPPWIFKFDLLSSRNQQNAGYNCILNPPAANKKAFYAFIDFSRLFVQWFMVAVVTGGLIITFKDKKPKDEQKHIVD